MPGAFAQRLWRPFQRLFLWWWFRPRPAVTADEPPPPREPEPPPPPPLPPAPPKPKPKPAVAADDSGSLDFTLKDQLLDKLPLYYLHLRNIRQVDPGVYDYLSTVGTHLVPAGKGFDSDGKVPGWFRETRPGMIALAPLWPDSSEWARVKFVFATKVKPRPPFIEPGSGDCYMVGASFEFPHKKPGRVDPEWAQCYAAVLDDGSVKPLMQKLGVRQSLPRLKRGPPHERGAVSIEHVRWGFPAWTYDTEHKEKLQGGDFIETLFLVVATMTTMVEGSMLLVRAEKDGIKAAFGIDPLRMPRFFKDRIPVMRPGGRRQRPIFHLRRTHTRAVANGEVPIRLTFAGLREFEWHGYRISISVPGRDHAPFAEMPLDNRMFTRPQLKAGLTLPDVARVFDAAITRRVRRGMRVLDH